MCFLPFSMVRFGTVCGRSFGEIDLTRYRVHSISYSTTGIRKSQETIINKLTLKNYQNFTNRQNSRWRGEKKLYI